MTLPAVAHVDASYELRLLYADHLGWLQGWLRRKLGSADAAGIAQDVLMRVLARQAREMRAYLSTVALRDAPSDV